MLEFALAFASNLRGVVIFASVCFGLASIIVVVIRAHEADYSKKTPTPKVGTLLLGTVLTSLLACVPVPSEMWEMRVAMIKWHLASPENVQSGAEHISKIAKALECKYLGACEEPSKKKE